MVGRQTELAHLFGNAKTSEMLQGASVLRAALGMLAGAIVSIEQNAAHAVTVEKQRQHQSDRAAADDRDRNGRGLHIGKRYSIRRSQIPRHHSGLTPAVSMTLCQRALSRVKNAAVSAGDLPIGVA